MKIDFAALRTRAALLWAEFTAGQKAMLAIAGATLALVGWMVMGWASAASWTPLASGLAPEDAVDITTELDSMGVGYKLENAGTTVMVDEGDLYTTRIALAAAGLPDGGNDGYGILDSSSLTTSQFEQRVLYQRAIEGELAKTIAAIDNIDTATVHLVMPEDDLFAGDDVMATGSVLLDTKGDSSPSASQVQAIINLVSSSVEGLTAENVSVTDTTGRVLNAPGQDGLDFAVAEQRIGQKRAYEDATARAIEALLVPVTGAGKARVVVNADLDFDERQSIIESFGEAETGAVGAESVSTETYTGSGNTVGGVLGPDVVPPGGDGDTPNEYAREDTQRTFLVDRTTQEVISAPGSVRRLSVAVLIDESVGINTADIQNLVSEAAGLREDRGDTINVSAMTFAPVEDGDVVGEGTTSAAGDDLVMVAARSAGVVILVLIVLLLAYRSAKRSSLAKYPMALALDADDDDALAALNAGNMGELSLAGLDDDAIAALGAIGEIDLTAEAKALEVPEPPEHLVLGNQLGELIDRQPDDVAAVLRTWLADRRS